MGQLRTNWEARSPLDFHSWTHQSCMISKSQEDNSELKPTLFRYIIVPVSHPTPCLTSNPQGNDWVKIYHSTNRYEMCSNSIKYEVVFTITNGQLIIIILSCHQHGYSWSILATPPYRSLLLTGPQGYTPYPHRAAVCRFELVALRLLGHANGSRGEHHLWPCPCFSSSVLHVWSV